VEGWPGRVEEERLRLGMDDQGGGGLPWPRRRVKALESGRMAAGNNAAACWTRYQIPNPTFLLNYPNFNRILLSLYEF
jgi:hypothetical protein